MTDSPYAVPRADRWAVTTNAAPGGVRLPERFRRILGGDLVRLDPVYWLVEGAGQVEFWTETLAEQFPERSLVPFARTNATDDIYCFDGANRSGDPVVFHIHAFTTPGWEYRGEWTSFDSWLEGAERLHDDWQHDAG